MSRLKPRPTKLSRSFFFNFFYQFLLCVSVSVAGGDVDYVEHFLVVEPAFQEFHEDFGLAAPEAVAYASGVWSDEEIFCTPQGAVRWDRFGGGDVDGGTADVAAVQCGDE